MNSPYFVSIEILLINASLLSKLRDVRNINLHRTVPKGFHELVVLKLLKLRFIGVANDDFVDVFIAAALVNPAGTDLGNEWVSILNLQAIPQDLTGWAIDTGNPDKSFALSGVLDPGEARGFSSLHPMQLKNTDGAIRLFDAEGNRVDRVRYSAKQAKEQGKPIVFAYREIE